MLLPYLGEDLEQDEDTDRKHTTTHRKIFVKVNGQNFKTTQLKFHIHNMCSLDQLKKLIKKELCLRIKDYRNLRIFNKDGNDIYDDDFEFLDIDGETYYVSSGADFDYSTFISEYEITKELGKGGFGTVNLGKHIETGFQVAIKKTNANALQVADDVDQVFAEAETLKTLAHPNIVKIYNCFIIKQTLESYFIMEHLAGGEQLKLITTNKRLEENRSKDIFKQIVNAIEYCHRNKIIHRDLKLENVQKVNEDPMCNHVKIVDFGIAGLASGNQSEVTNAGSLNYLPPEIFNHRNVRAGPPLDIWAMGCLLYAMLVGSQPFNGKTTDALKHSVRYDPILFPVDQEVSPECKDLVRKLCTKNSDDRITMIEIKQHPWFDTKSVGQDIEARYLQEINKDKKNLNKKVDDEDVAEERKRRQKEEKSRRKKLLKVRFVGIKDDDGQEKTTTKKYKQLDYDRHPSFKKTEEAHPRSKKNDEAHPRSKKTEEQHPFFKKTEEAHPNKKKDGENLPKKNDEAPIFKMLEEIPTIKKAEEVPTLKKPGAANPFIKFDEIDQKEKSPKNIFNSTSTPILQTPDASCSPSSRKFKAQLKAELPKEATDQNFYRKKKLIKSKKTGSDFYPNRKLQDSALSPKEKSPFDILKKHKKKDKVLGGQDPFDILKYTKRNISLQVIRGDISPSNNRIKRIDGDVSAERVKTIED